MVQLAYENFTPEQRQKLLKKFFSAIASFSTYQEVADFFKDLLSKKEIVMLARRLQAAQLLADSLTYDEVARELNMGKNTLIKINHWLKNGSGGYYGAIKKLNKLEKRDEERKIRKAKTEEPFTAAWLLNKYNALTVDDIKNLANFIDEYRNKTKKIRSIKKQR